MTDTDVGTSIGQGGAKGVDNLVLIDRSDQICAYVGVKFGLRYVVSGQPLGAPVDFEMVTRYPSPGMRTPSGKTYLTDRYQLQAVIGDTRWRGMAFSRPWHIVPGEWVLEIWHRGRKLAEKRFTVFDSCPTS